MYHIRKDKRSQQSAESIYKSLLAIMEYKSFEQISVTDIQKKAGIARTTFYRCFDNLSDVFFWKCDEAFHAVFSSYQQPFFRGEFDLARHFVNYWITHYGILEALMKINHLDIIFTCYMRNAKILEERYGPLPNQPKKHEAYYLSVRTGFMLSILIAWLNGGRKENADEIIEIIGEQFAMLKDDIEAQNAGGEMQ